MAKTYTVWMCDKCDTIWEDGLLITKGWKKNQKCPECKKGKLTKTPITI